MFPFVENSLHTVARSGPTLAVLSLAMDNEARLQALAEAFYQRSAPAGHDREFWLRHYLDFAREVLKADRTTFRLIRDIAQTQYERLPPRDKMLGVGRVLQKIVEMADAAIHAE